MKTLIKKNTSNPNSSVFPFLKFKPLSPPPPPPPANLSLHRPAASFLAETEFPLPLQLTPPPLFPAPAPPLPPLLETAECLLLLPSWISFQCKKGVAGVVPYFRWSDTVVFLRRRQELARMSALVAILNKFISWSYKMVSLTPFGTQGEKFGRDREDGQL